ncbi:MAG: Sec-independent protein translocase subunit TatA/TatB [Solirubrobacteraceae bacterium]
MPLGIGPLELIIVLVIALVVFGPKRLPDLGRSLGSGMREFKESISGNSKDDDEDEPSKLQASSADESSNLQASSADEQDDAVTRQRS